MVIHVFDSESRPGRRAFTLIELLVAVSIIAVLIALLLPAVQQAREAGRRIQCRNNLKQIGLALHNYVDAYRVLPPGYIYDPRPGGEFLGWGWGAMILPQLEQAPLFNELSKTMGQGADGTPAALLQTPLKVFRCPSDTGEISVDLLAVPGLNAADNTPGAMVIASLSLARSNYFGVAGSWNNGGVETGLNSSGVPGVAFAASFRGTFGENSSTRFRDVTDGTSQTLFAGERYSPTTSILAQASTDGGCEGPSTTTGSLFAGGDATEASVGSGVWAAAMSRANSSAQTVITGQALVLGDIAASNVPATAYAQNANNHSDRGVTSGFGSMHTGGAHFVLGDGSVRLISDYIDLPTYRRLGWISDGSSLGEF